MTTWTLTLYELRRMLRAKTTPILLFIMPLLLIFILGSALSDAFVIKDRKISQVKLAVFDEDRGVVAKALQAYLNDAEMKKLIKPTAVSSKGAVIRKLKEGEAQFGLIIPESFSKAVTTGQAAEWEMLHGNKRTLNLTAESILRSFLEQVNLRQAAGIAFGAGNPIQSADDRSLSKDYASVGKLASGNRSYSAIQYYSAAMLVMFLLYGGMSAAISMNKERENYTLMRLGSMPIRPYQILAGKVLGNSLLLAAQAATIIIVTKLAYGVDWGNHYGLLAIVVLLTILATMSVAVMVALFVKNTKSVTMIFQSLTIIMTLLSGGFSPDLGQFIAFLGNFTLNHWAVDSMLHMMLFSDTGIIWGRIAVLGAISAALCILAAACYGKAGYRE